MVSKLGFFSGVLADKKAGRQMLYEVVCKLAKLCI